MTKLEELKKAIQKANSEKFEYEAARLADRASLGVSEWKIFLDLVPITIADVMLALEDSNDQYYFYYIADDGGFVRRYVNDEISEKIGIYWNFKDDNLDYQSQQTREINN